MWFWTIKKVDFHAFRIVKNEKSSEYFKHNIHCSLGMHAQRRSVSQQP